MSHAAGFTILFKYMEAVGLDTVRGMKFKRLLLFSKVLTERVCVCVSTRETFESFSSLMKGFVMCIVNSGFKKETTLQTLNISNGHSMLN